MVASTIPPLSILPCGKPFGNTQEGSDRLRSAPITDPLSRGFISYRSPDPLVQRAGRDHPFPIFAGSPWRERDVARRMRHGWPAMPGKKTMGIEPHPAHVCPTAERLRRLSSPSPLGVTGSFESRGLASSSSCRVPNCSRQESILEEWRGPRTWWSTC